MQNDITIVTLSPVPFNRTVPDGFQYLNYVSKINNQIELKNSIRRSLELVKTKYTFLCDDDDPMPDSFPIITKPVTFGDFHYKEGSTTRVLVPKKLELGKEIRFIDVPHKPIVETALYKQMIKHVPDIEICILMTMHYLLSLKYDTQYDKDFISMWIKRHEGLHLSSFKCRNLTIQWLKDNAKTIISMSDVAVKG